MKNKLFVFCLLIFGTLACRKETIHLHYQMAGAPRTDGIILQARLAATESLFKDNIPGKAGWGRFEISSSQNFEGSFFGPWMVAQDKNDFILRQEFRGLLPGESYYYRLHFGEDSIHVRSEPTGRFNTLQGAEQTRPVSLVMVTGSNFHRFRSGREREGQPDTPPAERAEWGAGFPGYGAILEQEPGYFIGNGDNVYYDHPPERAARTTPEMRAHWHRLYQMDNFQKLLNRTVTIWLKDDHDHRYNDSDTTSRDEDGNLLLPTHEEGMAVFLEQAPVIHSEKPQRTYRKLRLNADLELFLVEGRDYRSPNRMRDGPGKSIWGQNQLDWLRNALSTSNAAFKILVSPTPLVGPDDEYKKDNHTNPGGFRHERDQFFNWLDSTGISQQGFYIICGDRHWQYLSVHPSGIEEFSCGALVDANARLGRKPGDPGSTDPEGSIRQPYFQEEISGGFLYLETNRKGDKKLLNFVFFDETGKRLYQTEKISDHENE